MSCILLNIVNNVQHSEQDKEGEQHGAAAAHGVVALLLELCQVLLLLFLIVLVLCPWCVFDILSFTTNNCCNSGYR